MSYYASLTDIISEKPALQKKRFEGGRLISSSNDIDVREIINNAFKQSSPASVNSKAKADKAKPRD